MSTRQELLSRAETETPRPVARAEELAASPELIRAVDEVFAADVRTVAELSISHEMEATMGGRSKEAYDHDRTRGLEGSH